MSVISSGWPSGRLMRRVVVSSVAIHVLGHDVRAAEDVEQGGFAGVGISHDGGVRGVHALAFLALGLALFADEFEFTLAAVDAQVGETSVHFDPFFTHAACGAAALTSSGAAASLAVEVAHMRARRGRAYCMRASSTWSRASRALGAFGEQIPESPPRGRSRKGRQAVPIHVAGTGRVRCRSR